ncbi:class I SAM-dependent methyltransferase [Synechococcus sp. CS-1329]|uniref:class I SAM-dependent methyltransferase n=1 Tax=Synechococcus sp. CS-1329 TaxID=2847975 RepID=UPI00223BE605|nr:class I SAM-dependent methyltransferase [Synechococcus sp. CS-1329]MCT0218456.1 class I SAM-dependent methyltransferase [Synechococcus sp. CS-1329]
MPAGPSPLQSPLQPQLELQSFRQLGPFLAHLQQRPQHARRIQDSLRLMALHGILDPLSDAPIAPEALSVVPPNLRESLSHGGLVSRQRAVLLVIRQLLIDRELPEPAGLRVYCPEAVTAFAELLRERFPQFTCSEYLPDPADPRREQIHHEDICALSLPDASVDLVVCNEILEHVYDLQAALSQCLRVLAPGGAFVGTLPFAYGQQQSVIKAHHRGDGLDPEVIGIAEIHGNPIDEDGGSLVYQIPGWELLDQLEAIGFRDPALHAVHSSGYGVVSADIPEILVLVARRP